MWPMTCRTGSGAFRLFSDDKIVNASSAALRDLGRPHVFQRAGHRHLGRDDGTLMPQRLTERSTFTVSPATRTCATGRCG